MIGLIRKDFMLITKNLSVIYLFALFVVVLPIMQNPSYLMPILSLLISLLFGAQILATISLDEAAHWQKNVSAMPITPKEEVGGKYILSLLVALIATVIVSIIGILALHFLKTPSDIVIFYTAVSFCICVLYNSVIIPAAFKFGAAKCRFILFVFVALPTIIPFVLQKLNINIDLQTLELSTYELILIFLSFTLLSAAVSYFLSVRIRRKKI